MAGGKKEDVDTTPPSGGSGGRKNGEPLGVSRDYRGPSWPGPTVPGPPGIGAIPMPPTGGHPPRYYERHLDTPIGWDGPVINSMQADLIAAGLLSRNGIRPGVYDDKTRSAYKRLLEYANRAGINRADALTQLIEGTMRGAAGAAGPTRQPLVVQLSNPDTINKILDETAPDIIGRRLSDAEKQQLVGAFQSLEAGAQRSAYTASGSGLPGGPGGTVVEPPNVQVFAETKAKELHPEEAATFGKFRLGNEVMGLLGITGRAQPR